MKQKKQNKRNKEIASYKDRDDLSWISRSHALTASEADTSEMEKLGDLKMISIRIPENVIDQYKNIAAKMGLAYQAYIRSLLVRWIYEKR